ncbi:hypothetical protein PF004_g14198 [Phytophthora fragariae]|uniref:RxLR effector protein n=1 Tax=Phytophthora fragariae TaxID=53985 RepID=A0A6G0RM44_9STRA|nr:hypothetical protein PF004_g14198 [Phytophthora fragariae]KAE9336748.1 hypothetical protein PF008_g12876 [Phytophthora fragariae]
MFLLAAVAFTGALCFSAHGGKPGRYFSPVWPEVTIVKRGEY